MIIDGHTDVLYALKRQQRQFNEESEIGNVDLPRLRKGKILAAFFAIFPAVSDYYLSKGVDDWFKLVNTPENELLHVKKVDDLDQCKINNKIGVILHFEGSGGIDSEFHNLRNFYRLGLRSMGLSWSNLNKYATGVRQDPDRGLTAEGKELVKEMEALGIIIDVSHLNEKSFWDVIETASKPLIASHSNAYTVCNHIRNLKDEQIEAIKDNNGTIGVNFVKNFLLSKEKKEEITLETIKNHIDKIVELAGINHVSFGSDFDGATVPDVIKDVSCFPVLLEYLKENGYTSNELEKLSKDNFRRVMKSVWK